MIFICICGLNPDFHLTVSQRGVVIFRSQTELTDELQKTLVQKLGELTGKPSDSTWHIHPLAKYSATGDKTRHLITTDPKNKPAEDRFKNQAEQPMGVRAAWHTDISYEPSPADYSMLKMIQLPERGGGESFFSNAATFWAHDVGGSPRLLTEINVQIRFTPRPTRSLTKFHPRIGDFWRP